MRATECFNQIFSEIIKMLSLYDITVPTYIRMLEASIVVMEKGQEFLTKKEIDLSEIINMRLAEDMLPFHSQVNIGCHNTIGCVKAFFDGEFRPPQVSLEDLDYQGLIAHIAASIDELNGLDKDKVDSRFGQPLVFKVGDKSTPFTTQNFAMSFAIPNVYFHTTTLYDMLRIKGVPLSKRDYLGKMVVGIPD